MILFFNQEFFNCYLEGLELSEEELGDEGADKGGGNLLLGMAPVINEMIRNCFNGISQL